MIFQPHNYQIEVIQYIITNEIGALFLDAGLGKTSICLKSIDQLTKLKEIDGTLIVAPIRVVYNTWQQEIAKWENLEHLTSVILHDKTKDGLFKAKKDIYLINPEGIDWLYSSLLLNLKAGKALPFNNLIIDESTKFKSPSSKKFKILKKMLCLFKRRYILTGTPSPNNISDVWSQIYILDQGQRLGKSYYSFLKKYFYEAGFKRIAKNPVDISNTIADITLTMRLKDKLKLPKLIKRNVYIDLTSDAKAIYKKFEKDLAMTINDNLVSASNVAVLTNKCHQIANGRVYKDCEDDSTKNREVIKIHDSKKQTLKQALTKINNDKLLIAYNYNHDLEQLKEILGEDVPVINGKVSQTKTKQILKDWNNGLIQVLIAQPQAMSHGLNMQAHGNMIVWFSLTWNLENYLQFNARLFRQGVKNDIYIYHLIAKNTIDELIYKALMSKETNQKNLRHNLENYLKSKH